MRTRVGRSAVGGGFVLVQGSVGVVGGFGAEAVLSGTEGVDGALTVSCAPRPHTHHDPP